MRKFLVLLVCSFCLLLRGQPDMRDPGKFGSLVSSVYMPIASGAKAWLSSDDLVGANGASKAQWRDSSGNGNHFGSSILFYPFITNNVVNGRPAIHNSGTDYLWNTNGFMANSRTGEYFIVCRALSIGGGVPWELCKPNCAGQSAHPFTDHQLYENFGSSNSLAGIQSTNMLLYPTNWHIWHVSVGTNYFKCRFNGNLIAGRDFQPGNSGFSSNLFLGRGIGITAGWSGEMAEVILYDRELTPAEVVLNTTYLGAKFGISVTNASDVYSPTDYPGLMADWDFSTLSSNNNDLVSFIPDSTGNGHHWVSTGGAGRGTFMTSVVNGKSALWMTANTARYTNSKVFLAITNQFTIVVLHRVTNSTSLLFYQPAGNKQYRFKEGGANQVLLYNGSGGANNSPVPPQAVNQWQMDVVDSAIGLFANQHFTLSPLPSTGPYPFSQWGGDTGATIGYGGHVGRVLIWTNGLPRDFIAKLYYTNFRTNWGLP